MNPQFLATLGNGHWKMTYVCVCVWKKDSWNEKCPKLKLVETNFDDSIWIPNDFQENGSHQSSNPVAMCKCLPTME